MKQFLTILCTGLFILVACNEPYDPIGRNKPAPVLLINPLELAFEGDGGTLTSKVNTNADEITVGTLPEWIEDVVVADDLSAIQINAKPNHEDAKPRRGMVRLDCSSGDNSATQAVTWPSRPSQGRQNRQIGPQKTLPRSPLATASSPSNPMTFPATYIPATQPLTPRPSASTFQWT